ncbi:MAG: ATP-dependent 6-phosphofructokinase [Candidatus Hydrogenedentota bacterium]
MIKRIGIMTSGGDCPGLNAVIRAATKVAIKVYGYRVFGIRDGFQGLVSPGSFLELTLLNVKGILPRGGTILGTTNKGPFKIFFDRDQTTEKQKKIKRLIIKAINRLTKERIDALIVIGGDGSLKLAQEFYELGVKIVGVPKTIDNDLSYTDYTFGFITAVNTATDAIDKLHTTAESHHRILVLEVMGRHAGWIALYAGIAGGADVILIPEIPYDIEKVCQFLKKRYRSGSTFSIVVVAESAMPKNDKVVYGAGIGPGKIGESIGKEIEKRTGIEVRSTVLGHIQRGGSPCSFDRILGTRYGAAATRLIAESMFGHMVCLKGFNIESVPIKNAIGIYHKIDKNSEIIKQTRGMGISLGN